LPEGEVLVGRRSSCFLQLTDHQLSRDHFRLVVGETVLLEDLGSAHGTFVNDARVSGTVELSDGDRIRVGNTELCFRDLTSAYRGHLETTKPIPTELLQFKSKVPTKVGVGDPPTEAEGPRDDASLELSSVVYQGPSLTVKGEPLRIAESGLFLACDATDSAGTLCTLTLSLSGGETLVVNGLVSRVVYSGTTGMGIDFLDLDPTARSVIQRLVRDRSLDG
jgi:pSer/pThr/pTyr-binding forkhead associated (FHA) protein